MAFLREHHDRLGLAVHKVAHVGGAAGPAEGGLGATGRNLVLQGQLIDVSEVFFVLGLLREGSGPPDTRDYGRSLIVDTYVCRHPLDLACKADRTSGRKRANLASQVWIGRFHSSPGGNLKL